MTNTIATKVAFINALRNRKIFTTSKAMMLMKKMVVCK